MSLPTQAQAIADAIEAVLVDLIPRARTRQETYKANKGRYWQGLWTTLAPPADNADASPDYSRRPSDVLETWVASGIAALIPARLKARLRVDCYGGPLGQGWILRVQFLYAGVLYERAADFGPEHNGHPWSAIVAGGA